MYASNHGSLESPGHQLLENWAGLLAISVIARPITEVDITKLK